MKTKKKLLMGLAGAVAFAAGAAFYINDDERKIAKVVDSISEKKAVIDVDSGKVVTLYEKDFLTLKIEEIQIKGAYIDEVNNKRITIIDEFIKARITGEIKGDLVVKQTINSESYSEYTDKNTVKIKYLSEAGEVSEEFIFFTDDKDVVLTAKDFVVGSNIVAVKDKFLKVNNLEDDVISDDEFASAVAYIADKEFTILVGEKKLSVPMKDVKENMVDGYYQKQIALTFDDGPSEKTLEVLEVLEKYDAKATFFVLGSLVEKKPEILKEVHEAGNQVGLHSWKHDNYKNLSLKEMKKDLENTSAIVAATIGEKSNVFRPPYGAYNDAVLDELEAKNIQNVLWSVDTLDWKSRNSEKIAQHVLDYAGDGDVVLMHDLYDSTIEGLEKALATIKDDGYKFVTLDELY